MSDNPTEVKVNVLPAAGGTDLNIFTGEKKIFYFKGAAYRIDTIDSIAELVKFRGTTANTLIFYDNTGIGIIFNDSIMDRPQDKAKFAFSSSDELREWQKVLGNPQSQKQFVDFLKIRKPEEVSGVVKLEALLGQVQYLSYATSIIGDFSYDDRDNITVAIKIKDSETTAKLPQQFQIGIPLIFGSEFLIPMEIQLEIQKPRDENQRPLFTLTCPKFNRYWNDAVKAEILRLKEALPGYQIIAGSM